MKNKSSIIRPDKYEDEYKKILKKEIKKHFFNKPSGKINSKLFEKVNCPGCGSKKKSHFNELNYFKIVKCKFCDLVYVNPRPVMKMQNTFLSNSKAFDLYSNEVEETKQHREKFIFNPLANKIIDRFGQGKKYLLEIGCGPGLLLNAIRKKNSNYSLHGIDINEEAVKICRRKKLNVELGSFEDIKIKRKFDIIIFWAVFDHFNNPRKILKKCHNILNKRGKILIGNLNMDGFESTILGKNNPGIFTMPARLNFFNVKSMEMILKKTGFKNISTSTTGTLDVEIVSKFWETNDLNKNNFLEKIVSDNKIRLSFQEFLMKNNLSSHMTTMASK